MLQQGRFLLRAPWVALLKAWLILIKNYKKTSCLHGQPLPIRLDGRSDERVVGRLLWRIRKKVSVPARVIPRLGVVVQPSASDQDVIFARSVQFTSLVVVNAKLRQNKKAFKLKALLLNPFSQSKLCFQCALCFQASVEHSSLHRPLYLVQLALHVAPALARRQVPLCKVGVGIEVYVGSVGLGVQWDPVNWE